VSERFEAHVERGHERLRTGDIEGAIDDYSEAIRLDEANPTGWIARASALARKLDLDAAIADVRKALEVAPADWSGRAAAEASLQRLEIKVLTLPATIREFTSRRKYRVLTPAVIAEIPDDRLVQAVVDHVVDFRVRGELARHREIVDALPPGQRWIYAMWQTDAEVSNGGFVQFFFNGSGDFALEALEGYRRIGAAGRVSILKRAVAALAGASPTRESLDKGLAEFRASGRVSGIDGLDREWYELVEDDAAMKVKFIRANPGLF
jgi:tetratricopeptide (TPR) repeat protein